MSRNDLVTLGAALYARKCRGERIDTLERLPYFRLLFLRQREAGYALESTEYGWLLQGAMRRPLHTLAQRESDIRLTGIYRDMLAAQTRMYA